MISTRRLSSLLVALAAGCVPGGSKVPPAEGETALDTADLSLACAEEEPETFSVAIEPSCSPEPVTDWSLVKRWSVDLVNGFGVGVHAARTVDADGDGVLSSTDPMQIFLEVEEPRSSMMRVELYGADGAELGEVTGGFHFLAGDLADVDRSTLGAEYFVSWYDRSAPAGLGLYAPSGELWSSSRAEGDNNSPTLADLEGDGVVEALVGGQILNAATGEILGELDGMGIADGGWNPVAADLDRDGVREIYSGVNGEPQAGIFDTSGALRATCGPDVPGRGWYSLAVGNLDNDDDGEVLVGMDSYAAICDADGTLLAEIALAEQTQAQVLGIAQLDGDPEPELLIATGGDISAFERDFTPIWTYSQGSGTAFYPFALADLDGDGIHEILIMTDGHLFLLNSSGAVLIDMPVGDENSSTNSSRPVVADLDGDGLAEIIAAGRGELAVFENAEGGWPVRGAEHPWHGVHRAPHDRDLAGAIPAPAATWLEDGYNVWEGLPAGAPGRPDLSVQISQVCADSCEGEARVVVGVGNAGPLPLFGGAVVVLVAADTGEELGRTTLTGTLRAGAGRNLSFDVPASRLVGGFRATVSPVDATDECGVAAKEASWAGRECG